MVKSIDPFKVSRTGKEINTHKKPGRSFCQCYSLLAGKVRALFNKKPTIKKSWVAHSGGRGIRTPGGVTLNSFQDCRNRPLCHSSNRKQGSNFFEFSTPTVRFGGCKYKKLFGFRKPFFHFLPFFGLARNSYSLFSPSKSLQTNSTAFRWKKISAMHLLNRFI